MITNSLMEDPVLLRDIQDGDLPIFFEQQNDPIANEMAGFPARGKDAFMAHWARIRAKQNVLLKTILFNGQVAGNIVSFEMDDKREVGYWLGREYWGKGIATFAVSQFLQIEKARPLYGFVVRSNIASQRVLEKCGFEFFGEEKEYLIFVLR